MAWCLRYVMGNCIKKCYAFEVIFFLFLCIFLDLKPSPSTAELQPFFFRLVQSNNLSVDLWFVYELINEFLSKFYIFLRFDSFIWIDYPKVDKIKKKKIRYKKTHLSQVVMIHSRRIDKVNSTFSREIFSIMSNKPLSNNGTWKHWTTINTTK